MRTPLNPADYSAALAATIRRQREAAGLSQNKLAAASGISRTMLTHVERGLRFPTVDLLCRLARGLGSTPARILALAERDLRVAASQAFAGRHVCRQRADSRARAIRSPAGD